MHSRPLGPAEPNSVICATGVTDVSGDMTVAA
jgi:hypothetical protein